VSFTVAPSLSYPTNAAQNVDTTQPFALSADPGATSYRLSIGLNKGANDPFDSGSTINTPANVPGLPAARAWWARTTTSYGTTTATLDISFTAAVRTTTLAAPSGGEYFDPQLPFTWNAVSGASGYWLWVGTSRGASDLVNSSQLSGTSYVPQGLPAERTLYARLRAITNGIFAPCDVAFTAAPTLSYPTNSARNVDTTQPFTRSGDPTATSYPLTIGSSQGYWTPRLSAAWGVSGAC
jgi:trimeric autotransporter adhesin